MATARMHKIRQGGRVIQVATVVAVGVSEAGHRSVLGVDAGPSEDHGFWVAFLRSLVKRRLRGVRLAIPTPTKGFIRQRSPRCQPCSVAALPCALHEEFAGHSPGDGPRHCGRGGANDLQPTRPPLGHGAAA